MIADLIMLDNRRFVQDDLKSGFVLLLGLAIPGYQGAIIAIMFA
jgi:hypothetical protein